jgi:hypothetical protein
MNQPTLNQLYRGLTRRFENRARLIERLGFRYRVVAVKANPTNTHERPDTWGFFVRNRYGRTQAIPAAILTHATNRTWIDTLRCTLNR